MPLATPAGSAVSCSGLPPHTFALHGGAPLFAAAANEAAAELAEVAEAYAKWASKDGGRWEAQRRRVWKAAVAAAVVLAPPPGIFADVGAGRAGLARMAAHSNYRAVALDAALPPEGPYLRAAASFEALPFAAGTVRVAAFVASLHYAPDPSKALREAKRVLGDDGLLIIALTPLNETDEGAAAAAETTREEMRAAAGESRLSERYTHLTRAALMAALEEAGFAVEVRPSGLGVLFRLARRLRALLARSEFATFPLLLCRPRKEGGGVQ